MKRKKARKALASKGGDVVLGFTFFSGSLALLGQVFMLGLGLVVLLESWRELDLYHLVLSVIMVSFAVIMIPFMLYVMILRKHLLILTREGLADHRLLANLRGFGFVPWTDFSYVSRLPVRTRWGISFVQIHLRDGRRTSISPETFGLSSGELIQLLHNRISTAHAMNRPRHHLPPADDWYSLLQAVPPRDVDAPDRIESAQR